jgi:tetratricopeptide (TPR) repeat protein
MIQVEDDELTLTVADSLSSIGIADLDLPISADVFSRLQAVAHSGNVAKLIINQLLKQLEVKAYRDFLIEVLQATEESSADPQVVYPLLEANLDKLDDNFAQALRSWATAILLKLEPEQAQDLAAIIGNFSNLIQEFRLDKRPSNLEIGIAGYEIVATVFTRQAFPQEWATTQNNLGLAYLCRVRGERAENLEAAIRYFSAALEEYTRQSLLIQWATTQNNLGLAYLYRIWGERAENLEAAIRCFLAALQVRTREAFPQAWAATQNNLGVTYCQRIQGERAENLETAIHCYEAMLEVSTREAFPHDWAAIQNNLGNAYLERIQGEKVENLEAAIRCFLAALQVFTREAFPYDWATIQNNLGIAYRNRIRGERAENLEAAIRCFLAALQVRTREAFPQNYAETQFNLGLAYQDVRQLPNAYSAFATAIDTVESLREKIVSGDEAKQKLAEEWNPLYQGMIEVSLELHDYAQAIKYVERSEAGNLVELLARPDFYPEGNIPVEILNELNRLHREITRTPQLIDMEVERMRRGILTWKSA